MSKGIFILGMHRSGTSCLAGTLQTFGVYLGEVKTASPHNAKGNREIPDVWQLNDDILKYSGGSWLSPPSGLQWTSAQETSRDRILEKLSGNGSLYWGLKDPRLLFTLPFWAGSLGKYHMVATVRHPEAVASSLFYRTELSIPDGLRLWEKYNTRLREMLLDWDFPIISFDSDPQHYKTSIMELARKFGLEPDLAHDEFYVEKLRTWTAGDSTELLESTSVLYQYLIAKCV